MNQLNVLIVDDEPVFQKVFGAMLTNAWEARTFLAADNTEALPILTRERIDLVMCDYHRPNGTTPDLVKNSRSTPGMSRLPFLVCSGNITEAERLALYDLGYVYVIRKPTSQENILQSARKLVHLPEDRIADIIRLGRESDSVDYKESCDFSTTLGRASLSKDMIAMANTAGGTIVFGVAERGGTFEVVGLDDSAILQFEPTRFADAVRTYIGDNLRFQLHASVFRGKRVMGLSVSPSDSLLFPKKEFPDARLFPGRIYARSDAARSEEVRDGEHAMRIIDNIVSRRSNKKR